MQVIATTAPATWADRVAVVRSAVAALLLISVGALLAYACLATPVLGAVIPTGRPSTEQTVVGVIAWGFAILVPAGFVIIGLAKFIHAFEGFAALRPPALAPRLARALGPDHLAASNLVVPGGRRVHELVLGPFGIVVISEVPPPSISRHHGSSWEIRGPRGSWVPIEGPLERATRDAERVRGWMAADDRDFLVRVYAAVVTDDPRIERTPACAVVRTTELGAWLEALPVQRGLTPQRRERVVEMIQSVATGRPARAAGW